MQSQSQISKTTRENFRVKQHHVFFFKKYPYSLGWVSNQGENYSRDSLSYPNNCILAPSKKYHIFHHNITSLCWRCDLNRKWSQRIPFDQSNFGYYIQYQGHEKVKIFSRYRSFSFQRRDSSLWKKILSWLAQWFRVSRLQTCFNTI